MSARRILSVVGTRPNFMKTLPVVRALREQDGEFEQLLVHTGQHYDRSMSEIFFEEFGVGEPDVRLEVGSGTHAQLTARVMERLEPLLEDWRPDLVLVPGDVNSTLAAALVTSKLGIPIGHIEAGLRSFDRTMPEEVNRVLTDQVSDLLFTHSPEALEHLRAEGRDPADVFAVGNTMIDSLVALRPSFESAGASSPHAREPGGFLLVTLHRPALVDGPLLADTIAGLAELAASGLEVLFPVHPRTRARIEALGLDVGAVALTEPLGYAEFMGLVARSRAVLTDSGGIQEETTYLGIPCFTLRDNTERPVTCELGTNTLLGLAPERIAEIPGLLEAARGRSGQKPPLWDGEASERIADVLAGSLAGEPAIA
jgi:UDP-N-acetylglucosamine 2-epimerase (non-hydrolysing)